MTKRRTKRKLIDFTFYTGSLCMIIVAILIHIILFKGFFRIYNLVMSKKHIPPPAVSDNIFQNQQFEESFSNNTQISL